MIFYFKIFHEIYEMHSGNVEIISGKTFINFKEVHYSCR